MEPIRPANRDSARRRALAAPLAALALLAAPGPALAQGSIETLDGPAGRAWAGVGPETVPAKLALGQLAPAPKAWQTEAPWLEWARLLGAEAEARTEGRPADSSIRARLSIVAWGQNRSDDAWDHLAACTADPSWMRAVVPHLAPGVPLELLTAADFDPKAPLPNGVHLRPALPPAPIPAADIVHGMSRVPPRELWVEDIPIGEGRVRMRIGLEPDGVQVDVEHIGGGPVELMVTLPEPVDFTVRVEYLNWMRLDALRAPIAVRLDEKDSRAYVFGRFQPRVLPWTETLPLGASTQLERHGVQLRLPTGATASRRLSGFAAALRALFGWEAQVLELDPDQPPEPWPGIVMNFGPAAELERKFTGLISLVEHYALRAPE